MATMDGDLDRRPRAVWRLLQPVTGPRGAGIVDLVIAAAVAWFGVHVLLVPFEGSTSDEPLSVISVGLVVVTAGAMVVRRRHPTAVLLVAAGARVLVAWDAGNEVALMPAVVIALYTVVRLGDRRGGLTTALPVALVMSVIIAALSDDSFFIELAGEGAPMLLPIAVADAVRGRADRLRDLIDTEADARVQAERLRIARDLHDVVAHGLSTIAIQSGVAAHLLDRDADQAKQALEIINSTGKTSLEELRSMVGVLRSSDDAPLRPVPADPNDIGDLIKSAANAGIDMTTTVSGSFPDDVADSAVIAVHRIIQEALTNVARHGGSSPTTLTMVHRDGRIDLSVVNEPPRGAVVSQVPSTGVGIVGMRERAEALGGSLTAGPRADGGYEVLATVPYHGRSR